VKIAKFGLGCLGVSMLLVFGEYVFAHSLLK